MEPEVFSNVVVAGGTGLVGRSLVAALLGQGAQVTVLTRNPGRAQVPPGARTAAWEALPGVLEGAEAVFNLAGEGIADRRWTPARRKVLLDSRVATTRALCEAMATLAVPPRVLVNASAVGLYGPCDGAPVLESRPPGQGVLAGICRAWEQAADAATDLGVRVVKLRLGVVLAKEGGALPRLALPVKLFLGAKLGHGQQGFSWIHLQDLVALLLEAARNPAYEGPFNATAPYPVSNETFTRMVAHQLHRPFLPVPGFLTAAAIRLLLGGMGEEMLLSGSFVYPRRAQERGFRFRFERPEQALEDLL